MKLLKFTWFFFEIMIVELGRYLNFSLKNAVLRNAQVKFGIPTVLQKIKSFEHMKESGIILSRGGADSGHSSLVCEKLAR